MKKLLLILIFLNISLWAQSWSSSFYTGGVPAPSNGIQNAIIYNNTLIVPWNLSNNVLQRLKISNFTWLPYTDSVHIYNPSPVTFLLAQTTDTTNIFYIAYQDGYHNAYGLRRININTGYTQSLNTPFGMGDGYGRGSLIAERQDTLWDCTEGVIQKFNLATNTWTKTDTLPHFAVWMQTIAGQVYIMSGNFGWSYWEGTIQGSDSTTIGYLYKINSAGKKVQLAKIGNVINWATQFDYRITQTDTLIYINGWGYSANSQYGLYVYSTHNNIMNYLGHPSQLSSNAQNIRCGGVTVDTLHKIIYTAYGNPNNSCTDSTNSVWAYSYINGLWRKLPFMSIAGCMYQGATQLYYVTDTLIASSNSLTYNNSYNVNGQQSFNAIKDTVYDAISVTNPISGSFYSVGDTIQIGWIDNYITKSFKVYYRNSPDSSWLKIDSTSNEYYNWIIPSYIHNTSFAQFLVAGYDSTASSISGTTTIKDTILVITNVYLSATQQPTINIVAEIRSIVQVNAFYSTDSLTWTQYGTFTISNQRLHLDTLSKQVNFAVNGASSYYRLTEVKDTAVYTIVTPKVSEIGFGLNGMCYGFAYHGLGLSYNLDPGCGWVNNITKYYGTATLNIATDGTLSVITGRTTYPFPYTGMPDYRVGVANGYTQFNSSLPFIYNGREFWFQSLNALFITIYQLWMKDLVNNVSYVVATLGGSFGPSPIYSDGNVQAAIYGNYIIFSTIAGYPFAFDIIAPSYPSNGTPSISSSYHLIGSPYIAYLRNYFRGIDPKIKRK